MCKLGLFDYMKQAGNVNLHEQGKLSNKRYEELKSAQKMIKNFVKGTDYRVDIYDAQTVPADKFVYTQKSDSVFVEVTNLLNDKVKSEEFTDKPGEPFLRQIFKFIDKSYGYEEEPIDRMKRSSLIKYKKFVLKKPINLSYVNIA